jgi:hypothetical protein
LQKKSHAGPVPVLEIYNCPAHRSANAEERRGTRKRGPGGPPVNGIPIGMAGGYTLPSQESQMYHKGHYRQLDKKGRYLWSWVYW